MRVFLFNSRLGVCLSRHARLKTYTCLTKGRFLSTCRDETFSLPVGNNGLVSISVTKPGHISNDSPLESRVILYLPPGPIFKEFNGNGEPIQNEVDSDIWANSINATGSSSSMSKSTSPQHALACMTSSTVVTVNYRLGPSQERNHASPETKSEPEPETDAVDFYKYPAPVHDTLMGFDWIQTHLKPTQLGVFGSHIGGSLALMLALTEAQSLHGIAAVEPICDWPSLDDYCISASANSTDPQDTGTKRSKKPSKRKGPAPPDLVPLLEAREKYFTSFERCFDAFASPILFLRSAGRDTQETFPRYLTGPNYPIPVLEDSLNHTSRAQQSGSNGRYNGDDYLDVEIGSDVDSSESHVPVRRRKALSRWPPYGLDYGLSSKTWSGPNDGIGRLQITLPWVKIFLRNGSLEQNASNKDLLSKRTVLDHQGEEMVSVMRRACFWGREKGFGEQRVTLGKVDENFGQEVKEYFNVVFDETNSDL
ncbi:hypothetical protein N7456_009789 [Penicillium angulare]|uniref:Alpha/beta hydrolase fold-3 domain-containing protein n=1 Tax=Penicillium angulare TaxID=116970 RepID=A0A9W9K5J2_9EURO|nr:hypothetical protein N7456_009789 [Penicillium angulare]